MVGFENGSKHREAVLVVELRIVAITVNTCDFDLITRLGGINQISKQNDLSLPGETTRRN